MRTKSIIRSVVGTPLALMATLFAVAAPLDAAAQIVTFDDYLRAESAEREAFFRDKFCQGVDIKSFYDSFKASEDEEAKKEFMEMQARECSKR